MIFTDRGLGALPHSDAYKTHFDAALPNFGIRVGKRRKTFVVLKGTERRRITIGHFPRMTLKEARSEAHRILAEKSAQSPLFRVALDTYCALHLKPNTAASTAKLIERTLRTKFSSLCHEELATLEAKDFMALVHAAETVSVSNFAFTTVKTFLSWCTANEFINRNPLQSLKKPFRTTARERVLSDAELRDIWRESLYHELFGKLCRVLILSGQRLNQITSLEAGWIGRDTITFPAHVMKGGKTFVLPLTPHVQSILRNPTSRYFFPAPSGTQPFKSHSSAMRSLRAKLPHIPHFTLHDFRRTLSTKMAEWEICSIDVVEAILDHTTGSRSPIQRIYDRHNRLPQMRSALEAYETHMWQHVLDYKGVMGGSRTEFGRPPDRRTGRYNSVR